MEQRPKIIGLICCAFASEWIELSIRQALEICDDVAVNCDPFADNLIGLIDNTKEIASRFPIRIVDGFNHKVHAPSKAATLNKMVRSSPYFQVGNWVWMFDVDEFFLLNEVKTIKDAMASGDYNDISFDEKYFFINMQKHLKNFRSRIWRISDTSNYFIPTNKWTGPRDRVYKLEGHGMFHYSMLCNPYKKMELWKTENWSRPKEDHVLVDWMNRIYLNFDLNDEEYWITENEKLYGKKTPFWIGDMWADENGHLFTYEGKHPQIIEDAGLPLIKDFRRLYAQRHQRIL